MKKFLMTAATLGALAATSAQAAVSVGIGIASPGYYYAPAPVYYAAPAPYPAYYPWGWEGRRDYNWYYWNHPGPAWGHHVWVHDRWDRGTFVRGHWE